MASHSTPDEIIALALQLPLSERQQIVEAVRESLIDDSVDHGPEENADEVDAAWGGEIARRIADIDSGRLRTISSEDAWKIINGEAAPEL
jgi:putative addiction module component (TIGR02574 family)